MLGFNGQNVILKKIVLTSMVDYQYIQSATDSNALSTFYIQTVTLTPKMRLMKALELA